MRSGIFFSVLLFSFSIFHFSSFAQDYTLSSGDTSEVRFLNQRKFFIYKVDKGETLYSISKKFNIPQEEITEFNSELKDGLKVRMKLWIPATSYQRKEVKEERKKEEIPADVKYKIALFINFSLEKNISSDPSLVDSSVVSESLSQETVSNLEFYEGVIEAVDSLERQKLKVNLHVYDTEGDSLKTAELLRKAELKEVNLIISNGSATVTKLINQFSKHNHVKFATTIMNA